MRRIAFMVPAMLLVVFAGTSFASATHDDGAPAWRAREFQAPRATEAQAPRSDDVQAPRTENARAPRACQAKEPRWRED